MENRIDEKSLQSAVRRSERKERLIKKGIQIMTKNCFRSVLPMGGGGECQTGEEEDGSMRDRKRRGKK